VCYLSTAIFDACPASWLITTFPVQCYQTPYNTSNYFFGRNPSVRSIMPVSVFGQVQ
jgi:hypothetical protein